MIVGYHGPKMEKGCGRDTDAKLGNVPFHNGHHEIIPPTLPNRIRGIPL